ncbi:hypothetical protein [Arthrobacter sp. Ld5]|uniref:hypothetical protein n=1 Tax=Arthrobacter sp. Ld5 TaxID=649152 RepID=UPI003EB7F054
MDGSTPHDDALAAYRASFTEAPGFLNFASYGPPSRAVRERVAHLMELAGDGGTGTNATLYGRTSVPGNPSRGSAASPSRTSG